MSDTHSLLSRRQVLAGSLAGTLLKSIPAEAQHRAASAQVDITNAALPVAHLDPAHEGLVVAHLSDLHIGHETPIERIRTAFAAVEAASPDLLLLTGDFLTYTRGPLDLFAAALGRSPKVPTFACLGNHDHLVDASATRRALENIDISVLQNEHTVIELRGAPLQLVGIDDGTTRHHDVAKALKGVTQSRSRLVMTHSPPTARVLPRDEGLVCFAGHTHGGSIHVGRATQMVFSVLGQPYVRGLYNVEGNTLYVNRGLGMGFRVQSTPEVAFFRLTPRAVESRAGLSYRGVE